MEAGVEENNNEIFTSQTEVRWKFTKINIKKLVHMSCSNSFLKMTLSTGYIPNFLCFTKHLQRPCLLTQEQACEMNSS